MCYICEMENQKNFILNTDNETNPLSEEDCINLVRKFLLEINEDSEEIINAKIEKLRQRSERGISIRQEDGTQKNVIGVDYYRWFVSDIRNFSKYLFSEIDLEQRINKRLSKLSEIIDGAPEEIKPKPEEELPKFLYRGTGKIYDILSDERVSEETRLALRNAIQDRTVIDIGAGEGVYGLSQFADYLGVKNYIAIEPGNFDKCKRDIRPGDGAYKSVDKIHISAADMLTFIKSIPSGAKDLTILISGIDEHILGMSYAETELEKENQRKSEKYLQEFWDELKRVLVSGNGKIITFASFNPSEQGGFKLIHSGEKITEGAVHIWERED
jgi:hypothetical protein